MDDGTSYMGVITVHKKFFLDSYQRAVYFIKTMVVCVMK
jgi:hypothetical protein